MDSDNFQWYYLDISDENKQKGPVYERDIQVLWKTRQVNESSYVWRKGLLEWKQIQEVDGGLYERLLEMEEETYLIQQKLLSIKNLEKSKDSNIQQTVENILHEMEENVEKDENSDETKKKIKKEMDFTNMTEDEIKKKKKNQKKAQKAAEKKKFQWFKSKTNTSIYVKGLPEDISFDELKEFFQKAGILKIDPETNQEKIKIYADEQDRCKVNNFNQKGDALIMYAMEESVEIALDMLNDRFIRPQFKISIQKAEFNQKNEKNQFKSQYKKRDKLQRIKMKAQQDRLLNWEETQQGEGLKIVILKNVFTLEEARDFDNFFLELEEDIRLECEMKCGPIQRIKIYEYNPLGVIQIKFKQDVSAEKCIKLMHNRWFALKQIVCEYYDGVTNYNNVNEDFETQEKRIQEFGDWLES